MASDSARDAARPVPRIDHVMVLLDEAAYRDIADNPWLSGQFGRLRHKDADSSVAGRYASLGIAGHNTLIELFGPGMPGSPPLVGGLVFSFEQPGSSPVARQLLDESGQVKYHHDLVRRVVAGKDEPQPWYHLISVDLGEAPPFVMLLNEVTREYFEGLGAVPTEDGRLTRAAYLDAVLGAPAGADLLLRDIVGITLLASPERTRRITDALGAVGYEIGGDTAERVLTGPDLTIRLLTADTEVEQVAELTLALEPGSRGPDTPTELRFGDTSRLVVDSDDTAHWIFTRPAA